MQTTTIIIIIIQDNRPAIFVRYRCWLLGIDFVQDWGEDTPSFGKFVGTDEVDLTSTKDVKNQTFVSIRHLQTLLAKHNGHIYSTACLAGDHQEKTITILTVEICLDLTPVSGQRPHVDAGRVCAMRLRWATMRHSEK
jgi:hypothetical protein